MVIMVVVVGAAFTLFQVTATHEARQQEVLTQTQNLRAALYTVARDVRMAGSGLGLIGVQMAQIYVPAAVYDPTLDGTTQEAAGWFKYKGAAKFGVRPIYGTNGATDDEADTLTVFHTDAEAPTPLGQLALDFTPGADDKLTLTDSVRHGLTLNDGDILAVASGSTAVIVQAQVDTTPATEITVPFEEPGLATADVKIMVGPAKTEITLGSRFKPGAHLPGDFAPTFPAGSSVYNLRDITFVTFQLDRDTLRLMANYHDESVGEAGDKHRVPVAHNIEDFQVAYRFNEAGKTDLAPPTYVINEATLDGGSPQLVRAVDLAVVTRSENRSNLDKNGQPLEVMEHTASGEKGYARRVLTETVQLRNYGPEKLQP
jgi:hypothetical protein